MNVEPTQRGADLRERLEAFMDEHELRRWKSGSH
jgi:hypothetical protein